MGWQISIPFCSSSCWWHMRGTSRVWLYKGFDWSTGSFWPIRFDITYNWNSCFNSNVKPDWPEATGLPIKFFSLLGKLIFQNDAHVQHWGPFYPRLNLRAGKHSLVAFTGRLQSKHLQRLPERRGTSKPTSLLPTYCSMFTTLKGTISNSKQQTLVSDRVHRFTSYLKFVFWLGYGSDLNWLIIKLQSCDLVTWLSLKRYSVKLYLFFSWRLQLCVGCYAFEQSISTICLGTSANWYTRRCPSTLFKIPRA